MLSFFQESKGPFHWKHPNQGSFYGMIFDKIIKNQAELTV